MTTQLTFAPDLKKLGTEALAELATKIYTTGDIDERPAISSPGDVATLVMADMSKMDQEELWVVNLDTRNRVKEITKLYKGTVNSSTVRLAEIFRQAIILNSPAIIVVHNHPSGDTTPSPEDVSVTRAIREAGNLLDVELLDHLIIGLGRFASLRERGLGF